MKIGKCYESSCKCHPWPRCKVFKKITNDKVQFINIIQIYFNKRKSVCFFLFFLTPNDNTFSGLKSQHWISLADGTKQRRSVMEKVESDVKVVQGAERINICFSEN